MRLDVQERKALHRESAQRRLETIMAIRERPFSEELVEWARDTLHFEPHGRELRPSAA